MALLGICIQVSIAFILVQLAIPKHQVEIVDETSQCFAQDHSGDTIVGVNSSTPLQFFFSC